MIHKKEMRAILFVREGYILGKFSLVDDVDSLHVCTWNVDAGYDHPTIFQWDMFVEDANGDSLFVIKGQAKYGNMENCLVDARQVAARLGLKVHREDVARISR